MTKTLTFGILLGTILCLGLSLSAPHQNKKKATTYLALGDSYTICESVTPNMRWPLQLQRSLNEKGMSVQEPKIIARTGWRTDDMLRAAKADVGKEKYDMVSLLIGVNNEFQGRTSASFKPEFKECLEYAISHCNTGKKGVFVVSIPDYGYTPFGKKNQKKISKRLDEYNQVCKDVSTEMGVAYYDITGISRSDKSDDSLVAKDGLHPSAKQYTLWVKSFSAQLYKHLNP